jgi:hypothetical protein
MSCDSGVASRWSRWRRLKRIDGHKLEVKSGLVWSGHWFNWFCSVNMHPANGCPELSEWKRHGATQWQKFTVPRFCTNTCPLRGLCAPQSDREKTNKNEKRQTRVATPTHTSYATLLMWGESEEWEGERGDSYPPR